MHLFNLLINTVLVHLCISLISLNVIIFICVSRMLTWVAHVTLAFYHPLYIYTRRVPVEGKSSVCLICMNYRIIVLIIINISLCELLLSPIANTSRTHALARTRTHARAHAQTHTYHRIRSGSMRRWRPRVTTLTPSFMAGNWVIQINTRACDPISPMFWMYSRIKNC